MSYLGDQIQKERKELVGSKSHGKSIIGGGSNSTELNDLRKCVEEQRQRIKELESNKSNRKEQINRDLME